MTPHGEIPMQTLILVFNFAVNQGPIILGYVTLALSALYSIALLIPGDQPDNALKAAADFTAKYSRKPPEAK